CSRLSVIAAALTLRIGVMSAKNLSLDIPRSSPIPIFVCFTLELADFLEWRSTNSYLVEILRSRAFILILLAIILGPAVLPSNIPLLGSDFFQPILPARSVQFIIHRGVRQAAPENTLPAIQLAIDQGFEWVEVDVRLTKDGHHVIFHDRRLDK